VSEVVDLVLEDGAGVGDVEFGHRRRVWRRGDLIDDPEPESHA
jgi:hypothetical protein